MDKTPFITVVMPVKNEERFIQQTILQLIDQNYPQDRYEIIVADGLSTDKTPDIVRKLSKKYPIIHLIPNPGGLSSAGRNVGFKNGKGDYFVVVDGHCRIDDKNFVHNIAHSFLKQNVDCLGRPQPWVSLNEPTMQKAIALARSSKIGHSTNSFIHSNQEAIVSPISVGCAYSKRVIDKIGYVDENFDACEDVEFNYRVEKAGFKTLFTPKIAVQYYPREKLKDLYSQLMRYGEGRAKFIKKHPEVLNLDMFIPILFLLGMFLGPLSYSIHPLLLIIYLVFLLFYLTILFIESNKLGRSFTLSFRFKIFKAFLVIHYSLGAGLIKGFFKNIFRKQNS